MLPANTLLGQIELSEVYEYFDGPRLFAVMDRAERSYLVYWFDESEEATGWLYLPISENKLTKLRQGQLTIRQAYEDPETYYWVVYTRIPPNIDSVSLVERQDINPEYFPPEGFYIEYVDAVSEESNWSFETCLDGKNLSADVVSRFIGRLRDLVEDAAARSAKFSLQLSPRNALAGSLDIRFYTNNDELAIETLRRILEITLRVDSAENFFRYLDEFKINPILLENWLVAIQADDLRVEVAEKVSSPDQIMALAQDQITKCLSYLRSAPHVFIDSIKVPQANNLDTILKVLELVNAGVELSTDTIGEGLTAPRQVNYYRDAAWSLNLISRDLKMTTFGRFVVSMPDRESQYRALADSFDSTDFGWAWLRWANVPYMSQIDPTSAEEFLSISAPDLSPVTVHRRASTLQQWVEKLQPYHRYYNVDQPAAR